MGRYKRGWIRVQVPGKHICGGLGEISGRSEADGEGDGCRTAI